MFLESSFYTSHRGQTGNEGRSPRIWDLFFRSLQSPDIGRSPFGHFEDFGNFGGVAPAISGAVAGASGGFATYTDTATTASSVTQIAHSNGVARLLAGATAHHEASMQAGGATGATWSVAASKASKVRGFEARVRVPTGLTSVNQGAFIGLVTAGNAVADFMANTTLAIKDANLVGFHMPIGAGSAVRPVFRKVGYAINDTLGVVNTYVAGTWVKLGFVYDPNADASEALTFYVNNQRVAYLTQVQVDSIFPVDALMSPIIAIKTLNTTGAQLDVDWIGSYSV